MLVALTAAAAWLSVQQEGGHLDEYVSCNLIGKVKYSIAFAAAV